jgi:hypothetical protein
MELKGAVELREWPQKVKKWNRLIVVLRGGRFMKDCGGTLKKIEERIGYEVAEAVGDVNVIEARAGVAAHDRGIRDDLREQGRRNEIAVPGS